jgi:hypothetical protein
MIVVASFRDHALDRARADAGIRQAQTDPRERRRNAEAINFAGVGRQTSEIAALASPHWPGDGSRVRFEDIVPDIPSVFAPCFCAGTLDTINFEEWN